ncbi:MAG: hypothetical protein R3F21_19285 [Myxococcota bacterium]
MTIALLPRDPQDVLAEIIDEFTGVVGFAELLQGDGRRREEYAEEILQAAERALELVRSLSDKLRNPALVRSCRLDEVLLDLEPSFRRVLGPGLPVEVCITPSYDSVPLHRRDLEGLLLYLVAASRDARSKPGRVRVRSSRVTRPDGSRIACVVVEDEAGAPKIGDPRWFLLSDGPMDLLNPLTPFVARVREAGGTVRIECGPDVDRTLVWVELPVHGNSFGPTAEKRHL